MRILVKDGEMRFHLLHVHPKVSSCTHVFFPILMAQSGCCCWSTRTPSTTTVDLVEMTLVCFKHSQSFFLLPVFAFKGKRPTPAPGNSPDIKIDITVVFFERSKRARSHSSCSIYSQLNEELRVTLAFTSWQNKHLSSAALTSPGGIGTGDVFLLWLLHTSPPPCRTPACYHTIKWHLTGTALRLIWSQKTLWIYLS